MIIVRPFLVALFVTACVDAGPGTSEPALEPSDPAELVGAWTEVRYDGAPNRRLAFAADHTYLDTDGLERGIFAADASTLSLAPDVGDVKARSYVVANGRLVVDAFLPIETDGMYGRWHRETTDGNMASREDLELKPDGTAHYQLHSERSGDLQASGRWNLVANEHGFVTNTIVLTFGRDGIPMRLPLGIIPDRALGVLYARDTGR